MLPQPTRFKCPKCGLEDDNVTVWPVRCQCGIEYLEPPSKGNGDDTEKKLLEICDRCPYYMGNRRCKKIKLGCRNGKGGFEHRLKRRNCPIGLWQKMTKLNCVHRPSAIEEGQDVYDCSLFGRCSLEPTDEDIKYCGDCKDRLTVKDTDFLDKWKDPLEVTTSEREPTDALRNMLKGQPAFVVCGGPSARDYLSELNKRGVFSIGVNNAAVHKVRCQAFVHTDPPIKFSHSIWCDPAIMKFVPIPKLGSGRNNIRMKKQKEFQSFGHNTDCPNVWGFRRNSYMYPDERFFTDVGAAWGNQNKGVKMTGEPKTVCTMLCALRILYYLGCRRIYLVGVDFRMVPGQEYSFNQTKENDEASVSNNRQFSVVNSWLERMVENKTFEKFGLEIYNCYDRSGLRAFPHVPFQYALEDAIGVVEQDPDLEGWYEKEDCPQCTSWNVRWEDKTLCSCKRCGFEWTPGKGRPEISKSDRKKFDRELREKEKANEETTS